MRRKAFVCVVAFILVSVYACSHRNSPRPSPPVVAALFKTDVKALVEELFTKMDWEEYPVNVGLGSFYYGNSEMNSRMGSQLSFFFCSAVESAITNMKQLKQINRRNLDEVLNEKGFQMTDLVEKKREFEQIEGLDALLVGKCSKLKGGAWLEVRLIWVGSAEEAVVTTVTKNVPDVPDQPPNYRKQMTRIKDTIGDLIKQESDFHVTIEPERTNVYRKGDELRLYVKSERNCYIKLFSTAPDGETRLIFPNKYWLEYHSPTENFIRAGNRIPIPYESSFKLRVTGSPYGTEIFTLVASTRPFVPHDDSFYREKGAFPMIGNIDKKGGAKALRTGAKTVEAVPGSPGKSAEFAHSYCTIMTER